MSNYLVIDQLEGSPILWEYCRPENDAANVVSIPQKDGSSILAKCPPPLVDGENVIAVPQADGSLVLCGKCIDDECRYDNKTAYLGYASGVVPSGDTYLANITELNTWMSSSENYYSTIKVGGSTTIESQISVPSESSYKFLGESGAKIINNDRPEYTISAVNVGAQTVTISGYGDLSSEFSYLREVLLFKEDEYNSLRHVTGSSYDGEGNFTISIDTAYLSTVLIGGTIQAKISTIVETGECPCLLFQDIEFEATVGKILDDVKGKTYDGGIVEYIGGRRPNNATTYNMTDEVIYPGYLCKFIVSGVNTYLYKPNADNIEDVVFFTSTLEVGGSEYTTAELFNFDGGIFPSATVGDYLSSQADSWELGVYSGSGTFFVNDVAGTFTREQVHVVRFNDCKFSFSSTENSAYVFGSVWLTELNNCELSAEATDYLYFGYWYYSNQSIEYVDCNFLNCIGGDNLNIQAQKIKNCTFSTFESGANREDGGTFVLIGANRIENQTINLTAADSSGTTRAGNSIYVFWDLCVDSNISIQGSDGVGPEKHGGDGAFGWYGGYQNPWNDGIIGSAMNRCVISGIGGNGGDSTISGIFPYSSGGDGGDGAYCPTWDDEVNVINSTIYGKGGNGGIPQSHVEHIMNGGSGGRGQDIGGTAQDGADQLWDETQTWGGAGGNGGDGGACIRNNAPNGGNGGNGVTVPVNFGGDGGNGGNGGYSQEANGGNGGNGGISGNVLTASWGYYSRGNYAGAGGLGGGSLNGNGGHGGNGGDGGTSVIGHQGSGNGGAGGGGGSSTNGDGGYGGDGGDAGAQLVRALPGYAGVGGWGGYGGSSTTAYGGDGGDGGIAPAIFVGYIYTDGLGGCGGTGLLGDGADGSPYNEECDWEY